MNQKRGYLKIEVSLIGGAKFLRYDSNALCDLEDVLGRSIIELFSRDNTKKLGFREIRALLWAGLRGARGGEGPEWSLEEVGEQMDAANFKAYLESIGKAVRLATTGKAEPDPPAAPPGDPAAPKENASADSTGTHSG